MDNLSHYVFRRIIAATMPAGMQLAYFSPAINPNSVLKKRPNLKENMTINPGEILYYNLMHGEPDIIVAGMDKMIEFNPAGFNLNCGCPRTKIQKAGRCPIGAALMDHPGRVAAIIKAVKKSFPDVHFSIKIRAGMRHNLPALFDFCRQAEDAGTDAVIFHARSAEDQFKRSARHALFGELKQRIGVPLIGNGDIITDEQAVAVKQKYGLDGIMIGRGALLTPGIFRAIAQRLTGKPLPHPVMSCTEKKDILIKFAQDMENEFGESVMLRRTRLFAGWMCKGLEAGLSLDGNLYKAKNLEDIVSAINKFFEKPKKQYYEVFL